MIRTARRRPGHIEDVTKDPVPRMHLRPVGWNPFDARIGTLHASDVIPITAWSMIGLLGGSMLNKASTLLLSTIPGGMDALPLRLRYAIAIAAGCIGLLHGLRGAMMLRHQDVIDSMRSRMTSMIVSSMNGDWYGSWIRLRKRDETRTTEIEFRIDAIASALAETIRGLHEEDDVRRAEETARAATRAIVLNEIATLEQVAEVQSGPDTRTALVEFESFCSRMADPDAIAQTSTASTPEARADALIADAEDALRLRPDLVDRNGARIDDLVRVHLPRMVRIHTERLPGANPQRRQALDSHFDTCLELARMSVEESFALLQDERFDASLSEIRFMRSRRGEEQDDRPVVLDPGRDHQGGPGMTRAA